VEKLTKPGPELAVEDGAAAGPPHLLGLGHAAIDQEVGRCFGQRGTDPPGLSLVVWMRYVLGAVDGELGGDFSFGAIAWTRRLVGWIGELRFCFQTRLDDLIG
jgi:hypothetical protein